MADLTVYTYENIDAVAAVLNGVASIMGGGASNYRDMIKTLGMLGLLIALASFLVNPTRIAALSWYGSFMFVYFLMFLPVARVNIVDVARLGSARTIENVPAALALTASLSSAVGYKLTTTMETVMQVLPISIGAGTNPETACSTTPENECMFRFSRGGMLFGNKLLGRMEVLAREQPPAIDAFLEIDTAEFIAQCTTFDLSQKRFTYDAMRKSNNLWAVIGDTSPARYVTEGNDEGSNYKPCPEAYANLTVRRSALGDQLVRQLARTLYPQLPLPEAIRRTQNAYKDVASATQVGDASWTVKSALLQNTAINQTKRGLGRMGLEAGSASAVMLGQAEAVTFASTNASFITQSRLAEEALPLIRNGIEAMLYGLFPIAVLVLLVLSGPALVTAIKGFVFAFVWIQLWPPLYALVNYIGQVRSMQALRVIVENSRGASADTIGVAFANYNNIYNGQISDQAVMGYLIIAVPVIASSVIYGMNAAMGAIGGGTFVGGASRAGEAAGAGNVNMGNVSLGQQTLGPSRTDADVFSHTSKSGAYKYGLNSDGSTDYLAAQTNNTQGSMSIKISDQNALALKNSFAERIQAGTTESEAWEKSVRSSLTELAATNTGFSTFLSHMKSADKGETAARGSSAGETTQFVDSNAVTSNITNTEGVNRGTAVKTSVKGGAAVAGTGFSGGIDRDANATAGQAKAQGHQASETGVNSMSTDELVSAYKQWSQKEGNSRGATSTVAASEGTNLSLDTAIQRREAVQQDLSHAKEAASNLESVITNKASIERNILHDASRDIASDFGAGYLQKLGEGERDQLQMEYAARRLAEDHGLSKEAADALISGGRGGFTGPGIGTHGDEVSQRNANMTPAQVGASLQSGVGSITGKDLGSPEQFHAEKKEGFYNRGVTPNMTPNMAVEGEVATQMEGVNTDLARQTGNAEAAARGPQGAVADAVYLGGQDLRKDKVAVESATAIDAVATAGKQAADEAVVVAERLKEKTVDAAVDAVVETAEDVGQGLSSITRVTRYGR
jgi:conjugal transfer mating pair stabilization protein TraG